MSYHASDIVLWIEIDVDYLALSIARSRIADYFHLCNHPEKLSHPTINGSTLVICKSLRNVVSSFAESETDGVFVNAKQPLPIRHDLMSLNHPQLPMPLKTDSSATNGFVHNNMQCEHSKS